ncbi:3-oxoacyl-(acyl-carrier-protein) synthase [Minicystis rosea]|nr:3-oxoacyl-(acyl-carrier-protein) synthase [Minicystis rosea]
MKTQAFVASVGARCGLGHAAMELGFLLRTGIPVLAEAPLVDGRGEQITMAFDATLDPYLVGEERAAALAVTALEEAVAPLAAAPQALDAKLILCVDAPLVAPTRGQPAPGARLAALVHTRAKELLPGIPLEIAARSGAGAAFALPQALAALAARKLDAVIIGGAHTDYDPETIAALDAAGRLFSPQNLDAVMPGEAAAFVVLTREETARRLDLRPAARLAGVGTGVGPSLAEGASALDATALASAFRAAGEPLTEAGLRAGWALCDHTFEARRILEWQAAVTRTHALWGEPHRLDAPAQRIGHLGAAALPFAVALAAESWRRRYAPSGVALAFAGSDAGERGALLLFSNV